MTEYEIQKAFVKWCRQHPDPRLAFLYSPPNESRRSWAHAQKRRSEGMLAGVPDLHLAEPIDLPPQAKPGLFLEVKTPRGKLSLAQLAFKQRCDTVGYPHYVIRSANEGIDVISTYLGL